MSLDWWLNEIFHKFGLKGVIRQEVCTKVAFMCWYIWKGRNEALLNGETPLVQGVLH